MQLEGAECDRTQAKRKEGPPIFKKIVASKTLRDPLIVLISGAFGIYCMVMWLDPQMSPMGQLTYMPVTVAPR